GERAVAVEGVDLEIHGAVFGAVGVALALEDGDHVDLLGDVGGGGGLDVGRQAVEGGAVGVEFVGPFLGDGGERAAFLAGAVDGLVVHVGEVAHVVVLVGDKFELDQAAVVIVDDDVVVVAHVGGGVNGGAAVVETENAVGFGGAQL